MYNEKMEFKRAADYHRERQACLEQLASVVMREIERENDVNDGDEYANIATNEDVAAIQVIFFFHVR